MEKIKNNSALYQDWETFKTYKYVSEKLIEKGYKQTNVLSVDSYLTSSFEYWINLKNDKKEPNIILVQVLKNNDAIVYMELDVNEIN